MGMAGLVSGMWKFIKSLPSKIKLLLPILKSSCRQAGHLASAHSFLSGNFLPAVRNAKSLSVSVNAIRRRVP
ncbi:hypothetical protein CPter91_2760 [Collimonas pratensis]|uniref:Uncharacterized protein n=2 Tax=Collimonas pratensis TaxID=279113 RepID=A0A127Q544_9BURK|nr:hypothetical protein CPter91_2760 [Collimonas pratensis]